MLLLSGELRWLLQKVHISPEQLRERVSPLAFIKIHWTPVEVLYTSTHFFASSKSNAKSFWLVDILAFSFYIWFIGTIAILIIFEKIRQVHKNFLVIVHFFHRISFLCVNFGQGSNHGDSLKKQGSVPNAGGYEPASVPIHNRPAHSCTGIEFCAAFELRKALPAVIIEHKISSDCLGIHGFSHNINKKQAVTYVASHACLC